MLTSRAGPGRRRAKPHPRALPAGGGRVWPCDRRGHSGRDAACQALVGMADEPTASAHSLRPAAADWFPRGSNHGAEIIF